MRLEGALDALARRDFAHGERGVDAAILLRDHHAFVGLDSLAVAFLHVHVHDHGVAGREHGQLSPEAPLLGRSTAWIYEEAYDVDSDARTAGSLISDEGQMEAKATVCRDE